MASVKILPYRPPAWLIRAKYKSGKYVFSHLNVEQILTNVSEEFIWGHHFFQRNIKLRYSLDINQKTILKNNTVQMYVIVHKIQMFIFVSNVEDFNKF